MKDKERVRSVQDSGRQLNAMCDSGLDSGSERD
jgi:hypothetical protein